MGVRPWPHHAEIPFPTGHSSHQVSVPVWLLPLEQPHGDSAQREQALLSTTHPGPGEDRRLHQVRSGAAHGPLLSPFPAAGECQVLQSGGQWVGTSQHPPSARAVLFQEARLDALCPSMGLAILPGQRAAQCSHTGLPTAVPPSLHSAMASGTTRRTHSPGSMTGAMGRRRSLRRGQPCWDSRPRQTQGPWRSQGWPGPPLRMTSRWKHGTGPQNSQWR